MELEVLKKKISSYRTEGGHLTKISDEVAMEVLSAWEQWTGQTKDFYTAIGVSQYKMAKVIGKAKRLKREGHFPVEDFKEIKIAGSGSAGSLPACTGIEMAWDNGKLLRFAYVDQLVEFLKKVS